MAIKKSDLYSSIWAACDELRGSMDASQYKDYVLFMLFIKYISDKYKPGDPFSKFKVPVGASFADLVALKGNPDIGNKINTRIVQPIVDANDRLARNDFPDFNNPNTLGDADARKHTLTGLIAIFENPNLDFSRNRAEHDDILGDAYEFLMRHFATQSGKSKGQFYTPSEVSRIMAKVIGISPANSTASTTAYDPTCGSGSLLLKVAAEAGKPITLEGQENDNTTAGLARMNMILHDFPTAQVLQGNTLSSPKYLDDQKLRTYDYIVANPPFSDKTWSSGVTLPNDTYQRFEWGVPPLKQGDYAYLLHIIRSMKSKGKAACILPHGVLFRGNAEAAIRKNLVRSGYLKAIIGLPANLFYGTGIPACIVVLDKENHKTRRGVFMIDASKGFKKDGPKNRLREQDIHRIVDTFTRQDGTDLRYARMVSLEEIADARNDYNLNLPRYIDSTEPEDLQDIEGHLRGGIPDRDLDDPYRLGNYWKTLPSVRSALFESAGRPKYSQLRLPIGEVKAAIFSHPEFAAFQSASSKLFEQWKKRTLPQLEAFDKGSHPKELIHSIAEDLLTTFKRSSLLNAYDIYQHLMDFWDATMQDDCYLISGEGWLQAALPREIFQVKRDGKPVWPQQHDYAVGKRRFRSELIPASLLVSRYFAKEQTAIDVLLAQLAELEQMLEEKREEGSGEGGLLLEVMDGEEEQQKVIPKLIKTRLKVIRKDKEHAAERAAIEAYDALLSNQSEKRSALKLAEKDLLDKVIGRYPELTVSDIRSLVIHDKWISTLSRAVQEELDRVSHSLTGRLKELAERYATPLPKIEDDLAKMSSRVEKHLKKMGMA